MLIPLDEVVHFDVTTHDPTTGAVSDADAAPTFDVFEEATDTPILDDETMTKRTSLTGNYRGSFTASAANGFEAGKWYAVIVSATVDSVSAKCVALHFRLGPAEASAGVPKVDVNDLSAIAQEILKHDWTTVTGEASRSVLNALRVLRNAIEVDSGTLTVTQEDDTTPAFTKPVTSDPSAEPITATGADN